LIILVLFADALAKLEGNQEHPYKVPSRCLKPLHLIDYSVETDLLPFIQSQVEQQLVCCPSSFSSSFRNI
jgi:hypothetical protein